MRGASLGMSRDLWNAVDAYLTQTVVRPDGSLEAASAASDAAGLPQIAVSPSHGKLLYLLARVSGARKVLEIGTLAGYSTIWLARAVGPHGRTVTLEREEQHAAVARRNFADAGVASLIELRLGDARATLAEMVRARDLGFDLVFIDADKPSIPEYFERSLEMTHRGSIIVVDNVVRDGAVIDGASEDASIRVVRRMNEMLAETRRVTATTIQTVGAKGYDGFTIALVE